MGKSDVIGGEDENFLGENSCKMVLDVRVWTRLTKRAQHKKSRRSLYRLRFLYCTLEEISCAACITYFSAVHMLFMDSAILKIKKCGYSFEVN